MKRNIILGFLFILLFTISYLRDTSFIIVNAILTKDPNNYANTPLPIFLSQQTNSTLIIIKFLLMIVFSILFAAITIFTVSYLTKQSQYNKPILLFYSILFLLSFLLEIIGKIAHVSSNTLLLFRFPAHLGQSAILSFIIIAFVYANEEMRKN